MESIWKVKEAPFLGLTGMGGGVASLMFAGVKNCSTKPSLVHILAVSV